MSTVKSVDPYDKQAAFLIQLAKTEDSNENIVTLQMWRFVMKIIRHLTMN